MRDITEIYYPTKTSRKVLAYIWSMPSGRNQHYIGYFTAVGDPGTSSDSSMSTTGHGQRRNVSGFKIKVRPFLYESVISKTFVDNGERLYRGSG